MRRISSVLLDRGALDIDDHFRRVFQPRGPNVVDLDGHQIVALGDQLPGAPGVAGLAQGEHHGLAAHAEPPIADARIPQAAADIVLHRLQAFLQHGARLHLDQQMRAALEVEAEIDGLVRKPARQVRG